MAAAKELARTLDASPDPSDGLLLVQDDYAVRIEAKDDPRYWVRVERDTADGLVITDYSAGSRSQASLAAGVIMAIDEMAVPHVSKLTFVDMVPGGREAPDFSIRLIRVGELVKDLCDAIARARGATIEKFEMSQVRGKVNAVVMLT